MGVDRRPRGVLTTAVAMLILTTAGGWQASRRAEHAAAASDRAAARSLAAQALASPEIDLALLLAVQGVRLDNSPESRATLLTVLSRAPQLIGVSHVRGDAVGPYRDEVLSHSGDLRATITAERSVNVWDITTGERIEQLHGHAAAVRTVAFSPDDTTLRTTDVDGATLTWDLRGDRRFAPRLVFGARGARSTMIPGPGGRAVVSVEATPDGSWMRILDLATRGIGAPFGARRSEGILPVWRPDGGRLATVGGDGHIRTWAADTGERIAEGPVPGGRRAAIAYTADGRTILAASRDGALYRADAETLDRTGSPVMVGDDLAMVVAAPGGRMAATLGAAAGSGDVRLTRYAMIDLAGGSVVRRGTVDFDATAVAFAPNGRRLAIAGQMGELLLLDARTGRRIRPPVVGHNASVLAVGYSPGGTRLVTGGYDGRVALWNARTGERLGSLLPGAPGTATRPAFLPDGHTVLIAAEDGTVSSWDARPERWLTFACAVARRDLTRAEWARVLGERPYQATC